MENMREVVLSSYRDNYNGLLMAAKSFRSDASFIRLPFMDSEGIICSAVWSKQEEKFVAIEFPVAKTGIQLAEWLPPHTAYCDESEIVTLTPPPVEADAGRDAP